MINDSITETNKIGKEIINIWETSLRVTKKDLSIKIGVSPITIQRTIKKLIDEDYIERVGSNKNGYWRVIN